MTTDTEQMMDTLFENGMSIRSMKLREFLTWAKESDDSLTNMTDQRSRTDYGVLALPPVQRTPVWGPKQIVDLWDSVLRGLPIGSLYLVPRVSSAPARGMGSDAPSTNDVGEGWDLLDGQQRTRALLLGLRGPSLASGTEDKRCLWIDLAALSQTQGLSLHLTSVSQPFGYKPENGQKLSIDDRRKAREEIEGKDLNDCILKDTRRAYTHELFEGFIESTIKPKLIQPGWEPGWAPMPFKRNRENAACVPFHILLGRWLFTKEREEPGLRLGQLLPGVVIDPKTIEQLRRSFEHFEESEIALLRISARGDDLLLLFDRIGAGGSPLTAEERLYSIYKHHEPRVHDAVNAIYKQVGRVLAPTKIASCVIRIANALSHENPLQGNYLPEVGVFAAEMRGRPVDIRVKRRSDIKTKLAEILPSTPEISEGVFPGAFRRLFAALDFKGGDDPGIPKTMRTKLSPNLINVLLLWTITAKDCSTIEVFRSDLVRFVLFWGLCVTNEDKASIRCFEWIREVSQSAASAVEFVTLYRLLVCSDDLVALPLGPPRGLREQLVQRSCPLPFWRPNGERFSSAEGRWVELAKRWWSSGEHSLLWLQRAYLEKSFGDYDPSSGRDDETPTMSTTSFRPLIGEVVGQL